MPTKREIWTVKAHAVYAAKQLVGLYELADWSAAVEHAKRADGAIVGICSDVCVLPALAPAGTP